MTEINQNFSLFVRNSMDVEFDIGPDDTGTNLGVCRGADVESLSADSRCSRYGAADDREGSRCGDNHHRPVADANNHRAGERWIPTAGRELLPRDQLIANHGKVTTLSTGLMTVIDPAYVPNVDAFKAMFPEFEDIDDTTIQIALDQAGQFVDASWGASQTAGQMYLAAHFMVLGQSPTDTGVGRVITSESIGRDLGQLCRRFRVEHVFRWRPARLDQLRAGVQQHADPAGLRHSDSVMAGFDWASRRATATSLITKYGSRAILRRTEGDRECIAFVDPTRAPRPASCGTRPSVWC